MIAAILPWVNKNTVTAAVAVGLVIVVFMTGVKYEQRKDAAEIAEVNVPLAKQAGKDEAEVPADDARLGAKVQEVSGAVKQSLILNGETARLLNSVR